PGPASRHPGRFAYAVERVGGVFFRRRHTLWRSAAAFLADPGRTGAAGGRVRRRLHARTGNPGRLPAGTAGPLSEPCPGAAGSAPAGTEMGRVSRRRAASATTSDPVAAIFGTLWCQRPLCIALFQRDLFMSTTIQLCLLSHTNVGKTTLARTLLAEDIGEVQDAAHVTGTAGGHTLITAAQGHSLQTWDTPGFGDSARLAARLEQSESALGWFLTEVWDRVRDRPFWLSQRALVAARDHADIVLYLVNAAESPRDIGYLDAEMRILKWLGKPVLV